VRVRLKVGTRLFFSHLLAVILVSGSIGTYFYASAHHSLMRSLQLRLQNSASLVSQALDARELDGLRTPADTNQPAYIANVRRLREFRSTNPDISFLYVMRRDATGVVFVIDSDETSRQALPGQAYAEAVPRLMAGFDYPSVDNRITVDSWGAFLSGYAPLRHGVGRYLVGMDMRADEVQQKFQHLRLSGIISLLASVLLASLFSRFLAGRFLRTINRLIERCRGIAAGRLAERVAPESDDEFDELVEAFNRMSAELDASHRRIEENTQALARARDELELRVQERTRDLQSALDRVRVLTGLLPICANCKKIRNESGAWIPLEGFIAAHSNAQFSHGICPDCMAAMYSQYQRGSDQPGAT